MPLSAVPGAPERGGAQVLRHSPRCCGTILAGCFPSAHPTPPHPPQALVWCTWALIAFLLALLVLCYNLFPDYRGRGGRSYNRSNHPPLACGAHCRQALLRSALPRLQSTPIASPCLHPTDPASWEKRCNCLGTILCCRRGHRGQYRDLSGQQQRLSSRLGNIFAMVGGRAEGGLSACCSAAQPTCLSTSGSWTAAQGTDQALCCCQSKSLYVSPPVAPSQMLSHIDLSPSDILLAFSLAMLLQRIQRRRQRDQQEAQRAQRAQQAQGPKTDGGLHNGAAGTVAAAGAAGEPPSHGLPGSGRGSNHQGGIEMSPQGSPEPACSVCSIEELLSFRGGGSDIEAGLGSLASGNSRAALRASPSTRPLLSKRYAAAGSSSQGGAAAAPGGPPHLDNLSGTASFVPAHLSSSEEDGNLQLGAEKTEEGPPGREPRESEAEGPRQPVDAGEGPWAGSEQAGGGKPPGRVPPGRACPAWGPASGIASVAGGASGACWRLQTFSWCCPCLQRRWPRRRGP